jgi:hypothetical protein
MDSHQTTENQVIDCTFGCGGKMHFVRQATQPGAGTGSGGPDDTALYPRDFTADAWVCDRNGDHFWPASQGAPGASRLSLRADIHFGSGPPLATDPIGYQVLGLPSGHQAFIRRDPQTKRWYLSNRFCHVISLLMDGGVSIPNG